MRKKQPSQLPPSNTHITELMPQIFCKIFKYLPLEELVKLARVNRRFKVLSYQDDIYREKLHLLEATALLEDKKERKLPLRESLLQHLYLMPRGQYLPGNDVLLVMKSETNLFSENHATPCTSPKNQTSDSIQNDPKIPSSDTEIKISASLAPEINRLVIGAGGLKAALRNAANKKEVDSKKAMMIHSPRIDHSSRLKPAREAFKQIYMELYPYYLDFKERQTDSKVFRDFKDPSEIGAVLNRLKLFDKCNFFVEDMEDISFALETSSEWFESTLLGQFEIAYDTNNIQDMKKNAYAAYQLNGGMALVSLFISKNPVFFDHTFNPTLLNTKIPTISGPKMGFIFSDEFAKYMDRKHFCTYFLDMLKNCQRQVEIVSKVFVPDVNAMTLFINKVFEDSISEYLSAILAAAKNREDLYVYLNTLASSIYASTQFLSLLVNNSFNVSIDADPLNKRIRDIFSLYM